MEKLAAEMAAAEEAARRRAEEREREREKEKEREKEREAEAEKTERAAEEDPQGASGPNSSEQNTSTDSKEQDKPSPMETGEDGDQWSKVFPHTPKPPISFVMFASL